MRHATWGRNKNIWSLAELPLRAGGLVRSDSSAGAFRKMESLFNLGETESFFDTVKNGCRAFRGLKAPDFDGTGPGVINWRFSVK